MNSIARQDCDECQQLAGKLKAAEDELADAQEQTRQAVTIGMNRRDRLDKLRATVARVKAIVDIARMGITASAVVHAVNDALDSPVEPVRAEVSEGGPLMKLLARHGVKVEAGSTVLLVPLEKP